jgi:hypothetical protein
MNAAGRGCKIRNLKKRAVLKMDDKTHRDTAARVSTGFLWLFRACLVTDAPYFVPVIASYNASYRDF